jgi:eukaryotic-like serine/threonine-protein kinase
MRTPLIAGIVILLSGVVPTFAQTGLDLYQRGLNEEQLGHYDAAIKIYERVIRDFAKDRSLVSKAKLHQGYSWAKMGESRGTEFLNRLISDYKDQPGVVAEAKRFLAAQSRSAAQAPKWTEYDPLLIAAFDNKTGDPAFDESLNAALALQLAQSPYLKIFPYSAVLATLTRLSRQPDEKVTHAVAQDICKQAGVKGVLRPSVSVSRIAAVPGDIPPGDIPRDPLPGFENLSTRLRLSMTLEVVSCASGNDLIARTQEETFGIAETLPKLGKAAASLRAALGEPAESIRRFDSPRALTTNSLAALELYQRGFRLRAAASLSAARRLLMSAVGLDPSFASAYSLLSTLALNNDEDRQNASEAFRLRDRVSERERLTIEAQYHAIVLGDCEKTIDTLEHLRDLYPRDGNVHYLLGDQYRGVGRFELGLQELQEAVRLNPENSIVRESLMRNYMELNRLPEAKVFFNESVDAGADAAFGMHEARYAIAIAEGDEKAAQEQLKWLNERPIWWQDHAFVQRAEAAAFGGDLATARNLKQELFVKAGTEGVKAYVASRLGRTEALYGESEEARASIKTALATVRSYQRLWVAIVTYGLAGDAENVEALTKEIEEKYPDDTLMNTIWIPTATAALEVRRGNASAALKMLGSAAAYEPSLNSMWAVYVRGLAHLQMESGRAAAAEFQKIIDHRGLDLLSPLYPMAHLKMAEAYLLMGDRVRSQKSYQEFLGLWKNANPDIPVLREAQTLYGK